MKKNNMITEHFDEAETIKEYNGYYYKISDIVTIVILGNICGS